LFGGSKYTEKGQETFLSMWVYYQTSLYCPMLW